MVLNIQLCRRNIRDSEPGFWMLCVGMRMNMHPNLAALRILDLSAEHGYNERK